MAKRFVAVPKVKLSVDDGTSMQLIYGDEVDTVGSTTGRDRDGAVPRPNGTVPSKRSTPSSPRVLLPRRRAGRRHAHRHARRKKILIDGGKGVAAGRTSEAEQALSGSTASTR